MLANENHAEIDLLLKLLLWSNMPERQEISPRTILFLVMRLRPYAKFS